MIFTKTHLEGAFLINIKKLEDYRGFFARAWCEKEFEEHGLNSKLCQANFSFNKKKGTLRGLHFQVPPHQECKLMRCIRGSTYNAIIDLRPDSPTFKQWLGVELSADNHRMLYVPEGFANGYQTLEDDTEALYSTSQFYSPGAEKCVRWNDPTFGIDWPIKDNVVVSEKDSNTPDFSPKTLKTFP